MFGYEDADGSFMSIYANKYFFKQLCQLYKITLERVVTLFDTIEISCDQQECAPKEDEKVIGDGYKSKFEP